MANTLLQILSLGNDSMYIPTAGVNLRVDANNKMYFNAQDIVNISTTQSIPNGSVTIKWLYNITDSGIYIVSWRVSCPGTSGVRYGALEMQYSDSTSATQISRMRTPAVPTGNTVVNGCEMMEVDLTGNPAPSKLGIRVYHNAGSAQNLEFHMDIKKIVK